MLMNPEVDHLFRPTIVIFLDNAAEEAAPAAGGRSAGGGLKTIYEYFCDLCSGLDARLYRGMGLIHTQEDGNTARLLSIHGQDTLPDVSIREGTFADVLKETLQSIQSTTTQDAMNAIGYTVPPGPPQVYMVGESDSVWLRDITGLTIKVFEQWKLTNALICYILIDRWGHP